MNGFDLYRDGAPVPFDVAEVSASIAGIMYVEASTGVDRSMLGPMSIMMAALGVILYNNCGVKTTSSK